MIIHLGLSFSMPITNKLKLMVETGRDIKRSNVVSLILLAAVPDYLWQLDFLFIGKHSIYILIQSGEMKTAPSYSRLVCHFIEIDDLTAHKFV